MSHTFRALLRKVGSGPHTGEKLTREEAATATRLMLLQEATPAQIGAFMIAHRIRRPTGEELAGMLDAYEELGPQLQPIQSSYPVTVLGIPYDGRTRTAPLGPLTALVLATAGCPVISHGGDRMPTKEGAPLIEFWQGLGVDWIGLSLAQVQTVLEKNWPGFYLSPDSFSPGTRISSLSGANWQTSSSCHYGVDVVPLCRPRSCGARICSPTHRIHVPGSSGAAGCTLLTTVKGLEGSCDLPRERTAIIGLSNSSTLPPLCPPALPHPPLDRLHLHARDFGFEAKNVPLTSVPDLVETMNSLLNGNPSELMQSIVWNSGFYLWRCGACSSIEAGIRRAETLLIQGQVKQTLQTLQQATMPLPTL
ncbi:hypothetical protein [Leptodesmis sp.]|uniref:hypothetical protein n=1 Tax=Leptodesmis sp. TaxID=3100501 RepID=UPI0040535405